MKASTQLVKETKTDSHELLELKSKIFPKSYAQMMMQKHKEYPLAKNQFWLKLIFASLSSL
jgi:hypothetical protein